ncbi:PREDICTED: uncharacterized protein LOC106805754 [Priapulus caudatus]|uniref:Uncharacterized protein LOC106805754 n=1 Tax=Priapulus caudatus TaxID=37621 RepID=A0ABM1DSN5_PRICU|nr:PREDICTED: uncharacterized protein LOC106805754 [Priapulus caudatus]
MKLLVVFGLLYLTVCSSCLHLTGTWKTSEFFLFLAKFGFQKTNIHLKTDRQGYIYGNITSKDNRTDLATLVVVDKEYFLGYYHNKSIEVKSDACQSMFTVIDTIAYDTVCAENGQEYMLRRVPCPIGGLCPEHETFAETPLVSGFQFTYQIYDLNEPRFCYVSLMSCMEVDVIQDVDEYQTWPGWLILGFRLCIMVWFLLELRGTFLLENKPEKLDFYLHFGAGFLAWFVYLPIVAIIASQVSALWRFKLLLSVTSSADLFAYVVLVHMLWPTRAASYFQIQSDLDELEEEMEEFETETIIGEVPKAVRT